MSESKRETKSYIWKNNWKWNAITWSDAGIVSYTFLLPDREAAKAYAEKYGADPTKAPDDMAAVAVRQLNEYFSGRKIKFTSRVDDSAATDFQRAVWRAARAIPFGGTKSYGEIAAETGAPGAARAVGTALGANPVPIIVPCHRVLRAGGALGGFALGLDAKRRLLDLERM